MLEKYCCLYFMHEGTASEMKQLDQGTADFGTRPQTWVS